MIHQSKPVSHKFWVLPFADMTRFKDEYEERKKHHLQNLTYFSTCEPLVRGILSETKGHR